MEPKEIKIFKKFEKTLGKMLPVDQPEFIALLEREKIIDEETKKRMNSKRSQDIRADLILEEIEKSLPGREKLDRLFVVMKEYKQKEGLEKLAQEMENHLDPIGTPFECRTMAEYLSNNQHLFQNISYKPMRRFLVTYGVLTDDEQFEIDQMGSDEKFQMILVINRIINNLYGNQTSKLKSFLQLLEEDDNPNLNQTAKRLGGGSERVPADPKQSDPKPVKPVITQETTSEKFMEKYRKAKHDLGSEKLNLFSILFFGPSGAGKSTLLGVLLQQNIKSVRESTGILDRKLVQFKVAVQKDAEQSISQWKMVSIDEEILRLKHAIEKNIVEHTDKKKVPTDKKKDPTSVKLQQGDMKIDKKLQSIADSSEDQHLQPEKEDQVSKSRVQNQFTTSDTLIACYDSGGQPEFCDVMPAMTTITTGNIMVLDMSKNLHLQLDSEYFKQGELWRSSDTKTHYTTVQLLKTAVASIQSHATHYTSRSATNSCSKTRQLLVVGTHLDLYGDTEDQVYEQLHKIEKIICDDVLQDCSPISIIQRQKGKNTKIIHPIANKSDKDSDEVAKEREEAAQEIRTAIENMSSNDDVSKEIPISWLLFQYEIKLQSTPCILRSDCDEIANRCYIDEADIDDVLSFFHELGILLYYKQVKKLEHVVFSDPQWLLNQLTKIFELKYDPSYKAEKSIKKGIFRKEFLAEIFGKEFESKMLHYEDLLGLYVHLNIMASLSETEEQYFVPALLNPAPIDIPLDKEFGSKISSTLYIRFQDRFFPRGVFCCLVALSVQKNKTWKLQTSTAYKDVVVFQIENNREYLILFDKINYILVEVHHKEDLLPSNHQVLCYKLHENLIEVCSKIHLNGDFNFGFLCEKCESGESFSSVQEQHPYYPETLLCALCQHNPKITYDQLIWFIPPTVMDILNTKHSRESDAKRKYQKRESDTESYNNDHDTASKKRKTDTKKQFDCAAAASELKSQLSTLTHLNYDSMKHSLFAKGVITNEERITIDARIGQEQMMCLIADIIIPSLNLNICMKFKGFLEAMEESDDSALNSTAERLGGSKSVPDS